MSSMKSPSSVRREATSLDVCLLEFSKDTIRVVVEAVVCVDLFETGVVVVLKSMSSCSWKVTEATEFPMVLTDSDSPDKSKSQGLRNSMPGSCSLSFSSSSGLSCEKSPQSRESSSASFCTSICIAKSS